MTDTHGLPTDFDDDAEAFASVDTAAARTPLPGRLERPLPLVGAPMAGGPTTPGLVAAVTRAGGLGMLAAGYLSPAALGDAIAATRDLLGDFPFGVNVFVPGEDSPGGWAEYRDRLADAFPGVDLPTLPEWSDDGYQDKIALLTGLDRPVDLVTFTFGLPAVCDVERLHQAGSLVGVTVTNAGDARAAADTGADVVVAQGAGAGGHQSTFAVGADAPEAETAEVVAAVAGAVDVPVIAAGGVCCRRDAAALIEAGASAVAVGTLLLTAEEAGTRPAHREALLAGDRPTVMTRCFSGRPARALANAFTDAHDDAAPAAYPHVHYLTSPIRTAAGAEGDAENINLWAGTGYRGCSEAPAAEILASLDPAPVLSGEADEHDHHH
ncbi:NAD(P)H-dependent flavin oxidoreductase [Corynebacterium sp. 335C]